MGEIRYIIIAKQCEVAGKSSVLDGCPKNPFPQSTTSESELLDTYLVSMISLAT